jgi:hypothetical protein
MDIASDPRDPGRLGAPVVMDQCGNQSHGRSTSRTWRRWWSAANLPCRPGRRRADGKDDWATTAWQTDPAVALRAVGWDARSAS